MKESLWLLTGITLLAAWTSAVIMVSYRTGYERGRWDEKVTQTQILKDILETLEEKCR